METYFAEVLEIDQQTSAGRKITIEILDKLFARPEIPEGPFCFKTYGPGIRPDQESILDARGQTLERIPVEWLQDAPTSPETRTKIEALLRTALITLIR
jgi:hypothetical protein